MLAAFARSRRGVPLLGRVLNETRTFSDAAGSDDGRRQREAPLVFSRGGNQELRAYVLKGHNNLPLAMLEKSVWGTPIQGPGERPRYVKVPPPHVCNSVLTRAVEADFGMSSKAAELSEALLLSGVPLDVHTLKVLFTGLTRADALGDALPVLDAWLQQQKEALADDAVTQGPLQVMTQLMDTATRTENTQLLLQVLARMVRIGVTPSPQSLTTLLQCFMRLGHVNVAHNVLDWMRRNDLQPNVYSYTALLALPRGISESSAPTLLAQALSAYDKMRQDGVQPNARFYTELIRICGRATDIQAAEAAWSDAKEAGVERDLILYSAMIDTCAKCKDAAAALRVFKEMKRNRVRPDVVAYTSLLTALHDTPQAAAAARNLWRSMQQDRVQPNGMAIAAFLEVLLLEGEIDEALQTLVAAGTAVHGLTAWQLKTAGFAEAVGLGVEAEAAGLKAEAGGLDAAASEGGGDAKGSMLEGPVDLPQLYEHFIHAMAHKGQFGVVEQMARHMRSHGLPQTLGTTSALLTAQARQHGHTNAKWLLQSPGMNGSCGGSAAAVLLPDDVTESCLLGRGSPPACMHRLMDSIGNGGSGGAGGSPAAAAFRVGRTVANVVLGGLAVHGCTAEALLLYSWMKQQRATQQQTAVSSRQQWQRPPSACSPDAWTQQLLLFTALNAPREQQLELTLLAVKEAKDFNAAGKNGRQRHGRSGSSSSGDQAGISWDRRTRSTILAVMRQSEQVRELLGQEVDTSAEEREEQLQHLNSRLER